MLAAGAFGTEMETVGTTVSQIFNGTIRVTNPLARNLGLVTKEARDQLKTAIEQGKLYEFLDSKTKQFAATQKFVSENFYNVAAAVKDIFQIGSNAAVAPLFKFLNEELVKFRDKFISGDQFFKPALQRIVAGVQDFLKTIIPSLRVLFSEFGNVLNTLGERSGTAATLVRLLINVFSDFLRLVRQAIALEGLPGVVVVMGAVYVAMRGLIGLMPILVGEFQTLFLGILEVRTAMAALAAQDAVAFGSSLLALGPAVGTVIALTAAVVGLVYLFKNTGDTAQDAATAIERVNKEVEAFDAAQHQFAQEHNLAALIEDYKQLSAQTQRTAEETQRLGQDYVTLKRYFSDTEIAALAAGEAIGAVFNRGQGQAADEIKQRVEDLKKLKDALQGVKQGDVSFLDNVASSFGEAGSFADVENERRRKAFEEASRAVDQLALKYVQGYDPALKENAEFLQRASGAAESQIDYLQKQLEVVSLLTLSSTELIDKMFQLGKEREAAAAGTNLDDVNRRIGLTQDALIQRLLKEAGGHRDVAKARAERAIEDTKHTLTELENSAARQQALLDELGLTDEILVAQALANSMVISPAASSAIEGKQRIDDAISRAKLQLAEYQAALATFSARPVSAKKPGRGSQDRDELKDFLSEVEKQLGLLKKASDEIEKIAARVVDSNRKLIRELADSGVIAFSDSIKLERDLLKQQGELATELTNTQLELVQSAETLGEGVANATARRKGAPKGKGHKGFDARNRREELIKLFTDEIDIQNRLGEATRKAEETRSEIIDREVKHRVALRKQELANQEDAIKQAEESANTLQSALSKAGLLGNAQLLQGQINRSEADLGRQRQNLVRQMFPLADPETRKLLLEGLQQVDAIVQGPLGDAARALRDQLLLAGDDPAKLDQFRKDVADSINNEGLLEQLIRRRLELFKEIAAARDSVAQASRTFEELNKVAAATHAKPDVTKAQAAERALTLAQGRLTRAASSAQPGIDEINRLLIILKEVGVSDQQILEIEGRLNENREQTTRTRIENEDKLRALRLSELEMQDRIVDFDLQRLDLAQQMLDKRAQLGIITDAQYKKQTAQLIVEREALLLAKQRVLEKELATATANLTAAGGPTKNPAAAQEQLRIARELNGLGAALFDLKQRAYELTSPLLATADAFHSIGEAVGQIQGPAAKLKGVFDGLEKLARYLADKGRPNPEDKTLTAAQTFEKAGLQFQSAVLQFAAAIQGKPLIFGPTPSDGGGMISIGGLPVAIDTSNPDIDKAKNDLTKTASQKAAEVIRGVGTAVAGVLSAVANKDVGQAISGFGQLAELIPVVGPFVDAGLQIIGSFVSFFTAAAKKRTEAIAAAIDDGIAQLKHSFSTGAITLGETIRQLDLKLQDARRQLSGRKGGADALKKIEDEVAAEKQQLRDQAKKIQDDFRANLDLLRQPANIRDTIKAIADIKKAATDFLNSFESKSDAQAALADALDFVRRSIQELKDGIEKTLKDLRQSLREAGDKFADDERDILLRGRASPIISEAESKRRELVALEQSFRKQQKDLQDQIALEKSKIDYLNTRGKLEEKLARIAQDGGNALSNAADKLMSAADRLDQVFGRINRFPYGFGDGQAALTNLVVQSAPQASSSAGTLTLNLQINDKDIGSVQVGIPVEQHLKMSGLISSSRDARFNPVLP